MAAVSKKVLEAAGLPETGKKSPVFKAGQGKAARELLVSQLSFLGPKQFALTESSKKRGLDKGHFGLFGNGQGLVGNAACSWQIRASVVEPEAGVSHPVKGEPRQAILRLLELMVVNVAPKVSSEGNAMFHAQGTVWVEDIGSVNYALQVVLAQQ